jgi:hypothetical protein
LAAAVLGIGPAHAQTPSTDSIIAHIFATDTQPYDLTASLSGTITFTLHEGRWMVNTTGTFHEWRPPGQPRHWKISIDKLELPALLRPFSGSLQRAIEERATAQAESLESLHSHDLFILEELQDRVVVAGIRQDLVDEAIDRYGHAADKADPSVRRAIARWLYTSPTQRENIKRPRGPYAVKVVADDHGLIESLLLYYNWGQLNMTFGYITLSGRPFWRTATSNVTSEVTGLGRVDGEMKLNFTQHRLKALP